MQAISTLSFTSFDSQSARRTWRCAVRPTEYAVASGVSDVHMPETTFAKFEYIQTQSVAELYAQLFHFVVCHVSVVVKVTSEVS